MCFSTNFSYVFEIQKESNSYFLENLGGIPYNPAKVRLALRQPNQQERTKNAHSPQFKHIGGGGWAGSRKSSLAPIRLSPDYTGSDIFVVKSESLPSTEKKTGTHMFVFQYPST